MRERGREGWVDKSFISMTLNTILIITIIITIITFILFFSLNLI